MLYGGNEVFVCFQPLIFKFEHTFETGPLIGRQISGTILAIIRFTSFQQLTLPTTWGTTATKIVFSVLSPLWLPFVCWDPSSPWCCHFTFSSLSFFFLFLHLYLAEVFLPCMGSARCDLTIHIFHFPSVLRGSLWQMKESWIHFCVNPYWWSVPGYFPSNSSPQPEFFSQALQSKSKSNKHTEKGKWPGNAAALVHVTPNLL